MRGRIRTELHIAPDVLDVLNELIRHEDRDDHASVLVALGARAHIDT